MTAPARPARRSAGRASLRTRAPRRTARRRSWACGRRIVAAGLAGNGSLTVGALNGGRRVGGVGAHGAFRTDVEVLRRLDRRTWRGRQCGGLCSRRGRRLLGGSSRVARLVDRRAAVRAEPCVAGDEPAAARTGRDAGLAQLGERPLVAPRAPDRAQLAV